MDAPHECAGVGAEHSGCPGASNLPAPEHTLLLAQLQLHELNSGTLGPVANKATKILVTYRQQCPHLQIPHATPRHQALTQGGLSGTRHARHLLPDTVPFLGGPASLQPLHTSLPSPRDPVHTHTPAC